MPNRKQKYCPVCQEEMNDWHRCSPRWEIAFGEMLELALQYKTYIIFASTKADAVERAATEHDAGESGFGIARGSGTIAWIKNADDDNNWTRYVVYGEYIPRYVVARKPKQ
jgi:hypothetical protein